MSSSPATVGGRRHKGASVKTLKRVLKKAGLKVSGKKATLTRRAKKAHLKVGGAEGDKMDTTVSEPAPMGTESAEEKEVGGRRRRSKKSKGFRLY